MSLDGLHRLAAVPPTPPVSQVDPYPPLDRLPDDAFVPDLRVASEPRRRWWWPFGRTISIRVRHNLQTWTERFWTLEEADLWRAEFLGGAAMEWIGTDRFVRVNRAEAPTGNRGTR